MDALDMQHSQPLLGNRITYLASKVSSLSHNIIMKAQKKRWFPVDFCNSRPAPDKPNNGPPLKEKWKQLLPLGNRKLRNKERVWVALYRYTAPAKWQGCTDRDDDEITPASLDPDERK